MAKAMAKKTATAATKSKRGSTESSTPGDDNPLAGDKKLRALLKPLLPPGTELSPLTLNQSYHPAAAEGIDAAMGIEVRKGKVKLPFQKKEQEAVHVRLHTLSAVVPAAKAEGLVAKAQPILGPKGYQALVTATPGGFDFSAIFNTGTVTAGEKYGGKSLVVFFQAPEPFALLYARGTNGDNLGQGLGTDDIVRRLKAWAAECELTMIGAGFDWARLRFKTFPKDFTRFGGEMYLLCPEGFPIAPEVEGTVPDGLWDRRPHEQDELAPQIGRAFGFRTAADFKDYLGPHKELFLWWD